MSCDLLPLFKHRSRSHFSQYDTGKHQQPGRYRPALTRSPRRQEVENANRISETPTAGQPMTREGHQVNIVQRFNAG